ncbi:MAG TPA: ABC transporter permease [Acidobacteriota bacterium]|nr:ABC transporter permease [Acidobacteriota bacterium]
MSSFKQDFIFALRSLRKRPGFSAVVVLTLALGIGANAAVFNLIDALLLRPFPIPNVDRIVQVFETIESQGWDRASASPANFLEWKEETELFQQVHAHQWWEVNLTGTDQPERLHGTLVTPGWMGMLSVQTTHGRDLRLAENDPAQERTVVLGHDFWVRRYGADASIVGQSIELNGQSYEVVGVGPAGFHYPMGTELWAPLVISPETAQQRDSHYLNVLAHLRQGRSADEAQAALAARAERLAQQFPDSNAGWGVNVMVLSKAVVDIGAPAFLMVWQITVVFVLLIACVNVANLLLTRGGERAKELSLRVALGAGRWRLMRQLLTENLILSLAGALAAMPMAWAASELLRTSLPAEIRVFMMGWDKIGVDYRMLLFAGALAVVAAVIFGLAPALSATRLDLNQVIGEGGRSGSAGSSQRGRRLLVVAEVAVALMLLIASGLSIQGSMRLIEQDQGYDPDGLLTAQLVLPSEKYPQAEDRRDFWNRLELELEALPQVRNAAVANILPAAPDGSSRDYELEGRPAATIAERPSADFRVITPDFFETMRVPILNGRAFTEQDREDSRRVAIVSRQMARRDWPQQDPLGQRFRLPENPDQWYTVVGVAGDVTHNWFFGGPRPTMYLPMAQMPYRGVYVALRTTGDPLSLAPSLRRAVRRLDADQPVFGVKTQRQTLSDRTIGLRYAATIMGVFGAIALILSVVGIYGVMAYSINQRIREIGIRVALGALGRDVLRLTLGGALRLTAIGCAIGLLLAFVLGRFMESTLFGTIQLNLITFVGFTVLLVAAALLAAYVPSRRALRVDPSEALRVE